MTVYVDALGKYGWHMYGKEIQSCHLFCDTVDTAELHALARRIGLKPHWFQNKSLPHYDLTPTKRQLALAKGAKEIDRAAAVALLQRYRTGTLK